MEKYTELKNPFFITLNESGRTCPKCGTLTYLEPAAYNMDFVMEMCPECGTLGALEAPSWAKIDKHPDPVPSRKRKPAQILKFTPRG